MPPSWLRQWVRKRFPARRGQVRRPRFVRPSVTPLEDRLLLSVSLNLEVPPSSSYSANNSLVIQYTNTGPTDAPAPVLVLSADKANLWLPNDPSVSGPSLQVLATNPDPNGPVGTLAPGASGSIVVDFASTSSTTSDPINFSLGQLTAGQTIDWSSIESSMRPSSINPTAWNAVFANFVANVGGTTDSYQAALDADATYLAQLGEPTNDVAGLVAYEISKADNDFGTAPLGAAVDLSVPTPGPALSFTRSFQPTVAGRNQTGLDGLGWTSNWDISASTDSQGNVTIREAGVLRYFTLQSDGSYLATLGDNGTLTALFGGGYQLTELDGGITAFNANGTLNYVQDPNGNRITVGYNSSGQMISLTASNGDALTIAYNSQGFISNITDPSGEIASYNYDAAGHLLSVTTPQGTTEYSYVTGTGTPADNALQSILNPDGTQLDSTYDSEGWLTGIFYGTAANPIEPVTVSYLSPGGVTYTDADGNKTTVLYTNLGQAAVITNPLGYTTTLSYDPRGDLTSAVLPGGITYAYTYDIQGDLLSATDGLGYTNTFTYDIHGNRTSYTDANGNTTSYDYDSRDNLLSVTYANGTEQSYTYNPLGEATQFVNARSQAISYTYNTQGQLTGEMFADGTSYSYSYDAYGNLISATDDQGRITKFIYGGDPNNPNNPDLLTEVEYPDGTYLKFSYYAGGKRMQSVDQTGFTINYTYDTAGRLSKLTDGSGNLIVQYTYDPAGNLIQQDNGNGTRAVYTYNATGNVLSITDLAPDHITVNSFDQYTYDPLGNVLTDTNEDGQWVYTYSANSQLIGAVFTPNSSDPDGLTAQNIRYVYDAAGNRVSVTINGVTTTYAVNSVNEYTSSTTNGVTTTYQYDADGNRIAQTTGSNTTNYTFNELSQLTGISGPGLTASYVYNPLGNRVSQTVNGVTTNLQIDPAGNVVATFSGTSAYRNSGLLAHYTYGLGLVSQVTASGMAYYYDFALAGNTIGITNSAGSYVNKYSYLPFGQMTTLAAALPNSFTFGGQFGVMQDAPTLFDMVVQEYASGTGQFLSNGTSGLFGSATNFYGYVINNLLPVFDPTGLHYTLSLSALTTSITLSLPDWLQLNWVFQWWVQPWNGFGGSLGDFIENYMPYNFSDLWPLTLVEADQASAVTEILLVSDITSGPTATTTDSSQAGTSTEPPTESILESFEVWSGSIGEPITSADVEFDDLENPSYDVSATSVSIQQGLGLYQYMIYVTVTFPVDDEYGVTVTVNGIVVESPGFDAVTVNGPVSPPPSPPPTPPSPPPSLPPTLPSPPPSLSPTPPSPPLSLPPTPPSPPLSLPPTPPSAAPSPPSAPPNVPPLLVFLNGLLGEIETVNANGTTITESFFGIPLVVESFDSSGNLVSATLFGVPLPAFLLNL